MRRLVLSLMVAGTAALLTACGQGGSAFSFNGSNQNIDHIIISDQTNSNLTGIFRVVPGGQLSLQAEGVKSPNNTNVPDTNFTFNMAIAPAGTPIPVSGSGQNAVCTGLTQTVGPTAGLAIALSPTFVGTYLKQNQTAGGSVVLTAPTVAQIAASVAPNVATAPANYCLTIIATHSPDGKVGTATVYVGN